MPARRAPTPPCSGIGSATDQIPGARRQAFREVVGAAACSQLLSQLMYQFRSALSEPFELHLKLSDEATSAAIGRKRPVLFAADVELDQRSAHVLYTKAEFRG